MYTQECVPEQTYKSVNHLNLPKSGWYNEYSSSLLYLCALDFLPNLIFGMQLTDMLVCCVYLHLTALFTALNDPSRNNKLTLYTTARCKPTTTAALTRSSSRSDVLRIQTSEVERCNHATKLLCYFFSPR